MVTTTMKGMLLAHYLHQGKFRPSGKRHQQIMAAQAWLARLRMQMRSCCASSADSTLASMSAEPLEQSAARWTAYAHSSMPAALMHGGTMFHTCLLDQLQACVLRLNSTCTEHALLRNRQRQNNVRQAAPAASKASDIKCHVENGDSSKAGLHVSANPQQ